MDMVVTMRPFVPARDFALSQRFYQALGFRLTRAEDDVAFLKLGSFSFILQNFYKPEFAGNFMMQMMLRNLDAWWAEAGPERVAAEFGVERAPRPPAVQPWGMRVGFFTDPSGLLWHAVEAPF